MGNFKMKIGEIVIEGTADDRVGSNDVIIYAIVALIVVILLSAVIVVIIAIVVYRWRVKKRQIDRRYVHVHSF